LDEARVDAALQDQIFEQSADLVIGKGRADGGSEPKTAAQPPRDVILPAAFPGPKPPGATNAVLPGIQAKHYLAESDQVVAAGVRRFKVQRRG
jgi:hypothetical protein